MKTMPRVLLLLFTLSAMTLIYVAKCGMYIDTQMLDEMPDVRQTLRTRELFSDVIEETERKYQAKIEELKAKISDLKNSLSEEKVKSENLSKKLENPDSAVNKFQPTASFHTMNDSSVKEYLKWNLMSAEILHGVQMKSEYEVVSFNRFTFKRIFLVDPGLGKRVVEKPIGTKKKDLQEVVAFGVTSLNKQQQGASVPRKLYSINDFTEGIYRTSPTTGTQYELYFHNVAQMGNGQYSKVTIMRPFGPLMSVTTDDMYTGQDWINMILPLQGRIDSFQKFMLNFVDTIISQNQKVFLTVVYFGKDGLDIVSGIVDNLSKQYQYPHMKVLGINETFSRGRALLLGAVNWKGADVVMFFCDVDIVFTVDFLERCRLNTIRKKRVYYPIVFSLYSPHVVYSLHDLSIPTEKDQLVISKETGFWRDFGYGMTCQYRSDFQNVKGFDSKIQGWGGEDVALYKKYVQSEFMVVRATDPGIFHIWHEKVCDPSLSPEQYQGCIRSKALNEASHSQLGLLAFKDEVNIHKGYKRRVGEKASSYLSRNK